MQCILTTLKKLRRPRLLIRAARIGAADYRRDIFLRRLLDADTLPGTGAALIQLIELETAQNQKRLANDLDYSVVRHLDLLIALMGEARILRASQLSQTATQS